MRREKQSRRNGIALVEFALMTPLLLMLLAGVLNYSMSLRKATSVAVAARVGAQYGGASTARAGDTAGIQSAAVNAVPDVSGMTVTSSTSCQCPGGVAVNCSGSCTGGAMLVYLQVKAQATAATVFRYAGLGFSGAVSSTATVRVQ